MRLYLQGKETIYIPFMLQHFERQGGTGHVMTSTPRNVMVEIVCVSSTKVIAKVDVNVVKAGSIVDRVHRFFAPENKQFVVGIEMPSGCNGIYCAHDQVRAELEP